MSTPNSLGHIPVSERWLHEEDNSARLDRALAAVVQKPVKTNLDTLEDQLR